MYVRDLTFVNFVYMRGGMCVRDEAVWCVLIVCVGQRDSVIGCVLHVNARGSLGVYIGRASMVERLESVCMERLEFVGAVRVGVESESCWSRAVEIVVILVSSERAKKADDSCISESASGVRRISIIVL